MIFFQDFVWTSVPGFHCVSLAEHHSLFILLFVQLSSKDHSRVLIPFTTSQAYLAASHFPPLLICLVVYLNNIILTIKQNSQNLCFVSLLCPFLYMQLLKEKHDNTILIAEAVRQKKLLGKYNRGWWHCTFSISFGNIWRNIISNNHMDPNHEHRLTWLYQGIPITS